jgi:hypothetical protein
VDKVAAKDVHNSFVSSVQKLCQEKILFATSTGDGEGDENSLNNNLERSVHNTDGPDGICQMESENCIQRSLSKVKKVSLSKRNIPSTVDAQHGDLNTENNTGKTSILRTDDQCQMESRNPVQQRLAKVRTKNPHFVLFKLVKSFYQNDIKTSYRTMTSKMNTCLMYPPSTSFVIS